MDSRVKPLMSLLQCLEERLVIGFTVIDPPSSTTTIHDMVKRVLIPNSCAPGHTSTSNTFLLLKYFITTFYHNLQPYQYFVLRKTDLTGYFPLILGNV